jgi:hypothetical protein
VYSNIECEDVMVAFASVFHKWSSCTTRPTDTSCDVTTTPNP